MKKAENFKPKVLPLLFLLASLTGTGSLAADAKPTPTAPAPSAAVREEPPCKDVELYDLKNAVLSVKDGMALASNPVGDDALPFKNGIAELKDTPTAKTPDWRYEITGDFLMRPMNNTKLRVVKIFENHLSGAGSWDRVMIFRCHKDELEKVFQLRTAGQASVKQVNELQFKVTGKPKAPEMGLYQWDARHVTFIRRHG